MDNTKQLIIEFQSLVTSIFKNLKSAEELLGYGERKFSHLEDGSKEGTKEKIAKYKAKIETFVQCVYPYFNIEEYAESYKIFSYYKENILSLYAECKNKYEGKEDLFVHDLFNDNTEICKHLSDKKDLLIYIPVNYSQININQQKWIESLIISFLTQGNTTHNINNKNSILLVCVKAARQAIEKSEMEQKKVKQEIDAYIKKVQERINPIFINTLLTLDPINKPFMIKKKDQTKWYLLKNIKPYHQGDTIYVFIPYIDIVIDLPLIIKIADSDFFSLGIVLHLKNLQQGKLWECEISDSIAILARNVLFGLINSRKGDWIFHTYQDIDSTFRKFLQSKSSETIDNQIPDFYLVEKENCNIMQLDKVLKENDKEKNFKKAFNSLALAEENSIDTSPNINPLIEIVNTIYTNRPLKREDIYITWAMIFILKQKGLNENKEFCSKINLF